jgi:lipopolysaccharide export system permease protein
LRPERKGADFVDRLVLGRLDRYVLAQLLRVFGFFSLVLVAVYWVNRAALLFGHLIRDGQPVRVFVELTALGLPFLIQAVLPVSSFVAAVYVALGLIRSSEITVMQAAGLSPWRLLQPVLVFGLAVTGFQLVLTNLLVPQSQHQLAIRQGEIARDLTASLLQPGTFMHPAEGLTVFIAEITPEGALRGLHVADRRESSVNVDYSARMALLVPERTGPKLVMIDGFAQIVTSQPGQPPQLSVARFSDFTLDLAVFEAAEARARGLHEVPTGELWRAGPELSAETGASPTRLRHERITRLLDPAMAAGAAILGYALLLGGGFTRLGLWRPVIGGVIVMALTQGVGNAISAQSMRHDWAIWATPLPLFLVVGVGLSALALSVRRRRPARGAAR